MPRSVPTWVKLADEDYLRDRFGTVTYRRGENFAARGYVLNIHAADNDITARVKGEGNRVYETVVTMVDDDPLVIASTCACPLRKDCKHVVGLLCAAHQTREDEAEGAPAAASMGWRELLQRSIDDLDKSRNDTPLRMGLHFHVQENDLGVRVQLTPTSAGETGAFVANSVSWHDITKNYLPLPISPEQRDVFEEIYTVFSLQLAQNGDFSPAHSSPMYVDLLGPRVWRLLREAQRVGIELVPTRSGPVDIEFITEPVRVQLDVRQPQPDGATLVSAQFSAPHQPFEPLANQRLSILGDPPHGVVGLNRRSHGDILVLAEIADGVPTPLARMVENKRTLAVPPEGRDDLLTAYLPMLSRQVTLVSSDDSVEPPHVPAPHLAVEVAYPNQRAHVQFKLRYALPHAPVDFDITSSVPEDSITFRDAESEQKFVSSALGVVPAWLTNETSHDTRSLRGDTHLSVAQTVLFVSDVLPALRALDGVEIIEGSAAPPYQRATEPLTVVLGADGKGGHHGDWFDLSISVRIGNDEVPLADLIKALSADDEAMVLDSGVWFELNTPELESLRRIVNEARELIDLEAGRLRLNVFQPDLWQELVAEGVIDTQAADWMRTIRQLVGIEKVPIPDLPDSIDAELRPYQAEGYAWLSFLWDNDLGGVLADDMGLGKTLQTLAVLQRAREQKSLNGPVLVIAPTSVVSAWVTEATKFAPSLTVAPIISTQKKRGTTLTDEIKGADLVVTSYTLMRLEAEDYQTVQWGAMILDEAQFIKNRQSQTYLSIRRIPAQFRLAITGTPLENSLMDLWSILSFATPGVFPDPANFDATFRRPIEAGTHPELVHKLRRRIKPFMLRRTKDEVAQDLPPKQEQYLSVDLSAEHRDVYDTYLQRERQRVLGLLDDMGRNRIQILRALTTLRMLALDPGLVDEEHAEVGSAKLDAMIEHLASVIAEGHRALIFSQFTSFLKLVRGRLREAGIAHSYLDGGTRDRASVVEEFTTGENPVFVISLKAGGFGLTLTEADYVYVLDPWWNPAVENQAIDRTHRIGQNKTVMVYRMVSSSTIEEKVIALQERKRQLFDQIVDEGSMLSSVLTADDVRGLFEE